MHPEVVVNIIFIISIVAIVLIYFYTFLVMMKKVDKKKLILRRFHNSILSVAANSQNEDFEFIFAQLCLNYNKLCQEIRQNHFKSVLDLLETIAYYYDSYTDSQFEKLFKSGKDDNIRYFLVKMSLAIKENDPFISAPKKESDLMKMIMTALEQNNVSSGENFLKQLSSEIEYKELMIEKKEKDNQKATIVSIVGLILTFFFGLLSFIRF